MSAYTKGKWYAEGSYVRVPDQALADVFLPQADVRFADREQEAFANARIMAAAPELLEALKATLIYLNPTLRPTPEAIHKMVDAAIAKAEGK